MLYKGFARSHMSLGASESPNKKWLLETCSRNHFELLSHFYDLFIFPIFFGRVLFLC